LAAHCCCRACEKSTPGFRLVSDPSLHSPGFSVNQYAPHFLERSKRFLEEKPSCEYLSDEFGKTLSVPGYWCSIFGIVVVLKISFISTIEFTYSTGAPLLIMSSPLWWKKTFF
jgi:hypothetical protein